MAKLKKSKKRQSTAPVVDYNSLPQNIHLIGDKDVEGKKPVYIQQSVYKTIHRFAASKTTVESGGMLVGNVIEQFGKMHIIICGFVEAKFSEATPTTLKFTHETWEHCHKEIAKKYPSCKILGWIHTHPDFGVFLSEYDEFIQTNFFKDENQVAYVIDPIQNTEGFYIWHNEKIERCKGFYLFDENGSDIDFEKVVEEAIVPQKSKAVEILGLAVGVLAVCCAVLFMQTTNLKVQLDKLQAQQQIIVDSANQSLDYLQQQIIALGGELDKLQVIIETEETENADTVSGSENEVGDADETDSMDATTVSDADVDNQNGEESGDGN